MITLKNGIFTLVILMSTSATIAIGEELENKSKSPTESLKNDADPGRLHPPLRQPEDQDVTGINGETTRMDTNQNGIVSPEEVRKYRKQETEIKETTK